MRRLLLVLLFILWFFLYISSFFQKNETGLKPFVCELYVRAMTAGMNELERLKLKTEKVNVTHYSWTSIHRRTSQYYFNKVFVT